MKNRTTLWGDRRVALAVLTAINLLGYIDRYVVAALFEPIQRDLHLSDAELGWTVSAFMIAYAAAAPAFGRLGDLFTRKYLIGAGVALWSLATAASALAQGFWRLVIPRTVVGLGEASYEILAPTLIADYFEPSRRGSALAVFSVAIPVGSALAFVLGGELASALGWRMALVAAGLPGVLFALLALAIREPERGASEPSAAGAQVAPPSAWTAYRLLAANTTYVAVTAALAAYTFALGGLVAWVPAFLERYDGLSMARANDVFGSVTVVAGLCGTLAGGVLGDYLLRYTKHAYLWLSGLCMLAAAPVAAVALLARDPAIVLPAMFAAEVLLFLNTGPLNAALVGCVAAEIRATAMAANILVIHALGDAPSPVMIGIVSDHLGLATAMLIAPVMMVVCGLVLLGAIRLTDTQARR